MSGMGASLFDEGETGPCAICGAVECRTDHRPFGAPPLPPPARTFRTQRRIWYENSEGGMQLLYGVNEDIDYDEAVSLGLVEYEPPPPPPPPRGKRKGARARRPTEDRMRRPKEDR